MTKVELLESLKDFTLKKICDFLMPVKRQKDDEEDPSPRAAAVYLMRLTKSSSAQKAAPYILHQVITGKDSQQEGERASGRSVLRSIFCVYNEDEQDGGLMLLGLMERLRIELLKQIVIGKQFQLDLKDGLEMLIYPDDTAPYYAGEMISTWIMPGVEREVII